MKTYQVSTSHTIFKDDFNDGEGEQVNSFELSANIKAETPEKAIEEYFGKTLYYHLDMTKTQKDEEKENVLYYSLLVDEDNTEAFEGDIELWKEGQKKLFSNNIRLEIEELVSVKI